MASNAQLSKIVLAHHIEVACPGKHGRVLVSALYLLNQHIEATAPGFLIESNVGFFCRCFVVQLKSKLSVGITTPHKHLCEPELRQFYGLHLNRLLLNSLG